MNKRTPDNRESWSIEEWTSAPLRLERKATFDAEPGLIFACLTDPEQMCKVFSWMHSVTVDNRNAVVPNGLGTKRRCHFGNGMVLEEVIVGWQPPLRYAYRGVDETHPFGMIGHLGTIDCIPDGDGTRLIWKHYFEHSNPAAMLRQLDASVQMAVDSLFDRFQSV